MNNSKNDFKNFVKNKKVAVFGLGVSGLSAVRFLKVLEAKIIAINSGEIHTWAKGGVLDYLTLNDCFSENDPHLKTVLDGIDLVILSPGIPRDHPLLNSLIGTLADKKIPVWGEIELAYRYLEMTNQLRPIIGITGTNGKTTTTTFLGEMIELDHKKVFVGGNIGVPFCDYAYDVYSKKEQADFILLELSSFQLESIDHFHVNIAMILNLYQNHGERYTSIEDYGQSKFNITNRFTNDDLLIYPEDFTFVADWAKSQKGKKKTINTQYPVSEFDLSKFKLPGIHNKVNLNFILIAAEALGLSKRSIQASIDTFGGVHHRIEFVNGLVGLPHFVAYNDAKSTNWDATITAVKAMEGMKGNLYLVIGGKKRGHGDSLLPYLDFLKDRVHSFYLIGEMGEEIEAEIKGLVSYQVTGTLEKTVEDLRVNKKDEQGIILFSPGFPSFDQFKNYVHRGEHFVGLLQK
ncbi:MAG: UDP-N-acetylmuramoyl-L-alanine--D-glutamate ligase [Bacteriovorax sp.]|nr:UDP-N-acetylmuramoyl-L-alanine--D-glutamate ligase [Bacteriovorax sp.]